MSEHEAIEISVREDGRSQIVYKKNTLKGTATPKEVMNMVLVAARLQAEEYVKKLSRQQSLTPFEIKALKELSDIAKNGIGGDDKATTQVVEPMALESVKANLYKALTEKISGKG